MENSCKIPPNSRSSARVLVRFQECIHLQEFTRWTGSATVTSSVANNIAVITIKTSTIVSVGSLMRSASENRSLTAQTHYVIVRSGINTLYLGTFASQEPDVGELRFIARLSKSALPNGIPQAEINGGTAIEGSDVFLLNGQTRSKFYSSVSSFFAHVTKWYNLVSCSLAP